MKQIRVGIIGQGRSGRDIHGAYLIQDERFKIVAVADFMESRRARAIQEYDCEAYAEHSAMLARNDLDLVVNAAFSHLHHPITLEIMKAGHHVLCEKPFARTVAMVDDMIAASRETGKVLAIFQQSRYAPYFQQVQRVIASGVLGRIVQVKIAFNGHARRWDWQTLQSMHGGHMMNTGPHPIDQALTLFGDGKPDVWCRMDRSDTNFTGDAENHVKLILTGQAKPIVEVEVSSFCAYPDNLYQVYGTCGGMKATSSAAEWRYFKPETVTPLKLEREPLADANGLPRYCAESLTWETGKWPETDTAQASGGYEAAKPDANMTETFYSMLYRTLTTGEPLEITPEQVRRQIAVMEACRAQNPHLYPDG